jgi:two-component system, chemotaxis family, chemotaxis protein CheY
MLATAPTSSTLSKHFLRILYADDLRELRDVARISFSRDGHGIECVEDGLTALRRVQADPGFDLVITDHHMPNLNGLELVTALRELPFAGKIMVFSSELSNEVAEQYRRLKVDRILYKPVFPSELRNALRELFPDAACFVPGSAQPARPPLAR